MWHMGCRRAYCKKGHFSVASVVVQPGGHTRRPCRFRLTAPLGTVCGPPIPVALPQLTVAQDAPVTRTRHARAPRSGTGTHPLPPLYRHLGRSCNAILGAMDLGYSPHTVLRRNLTACRCHTYGCSFLICKSSRTLSYSSLSSFASSLKRNWSHFFTHPQFPEV